MGPVRVKRRQRADSGVHAVYGVLCVLSGPRDVMRVNARMWELLLCLTALVGWWLVRAAAAAALNS